MRNGIMFFWRMDKIRSIARWSFLPLLFATFMTDPGTPIFFICLGSCILCGFLSFLPTPTVKDFERVINDYQVNLKEQTLRAAVAKNEELMVILHGYQNRGKMLLKRQLVKTVIYPHLASLSIYCKDNSRTLVLGRKSLLSATPAEYIKIKLTPETITFPAEEEVEREGVAMLTLSSPELPEELVLFVKNDYHYRDFLAAVKPALN